MTAPDPSSGGLTEAERDADKTLAALGFTVTITEAERDALGRLIDPSAFNPFSAADHTDAVRDAAVRILASHWLAARLADARREALLDAAAGVRANSDLMQRFGSQFAAWLDRRATQDTP